MATNTILQSLNDSTEAAGITSSNRRQSETFIASAAIAAGAVVSLDLSKSDNGDKALYVREAKSDDATAACPIGVAVNDAEAAENVEIIIRGVVEEAKVKGDVVNVAVGDALVATGVLGKLHAQRFLIASDGAGAVTFLNSRAPVAIALEAISSDATARVFVVCNF